MGAELIATSWQLTPPPVADHILTDPPYDQRTHAGHKLEVRDRQAVSFDPVDPAVIVPQLLARCRGWIVCFCALEQLGAYKAAAGPAWYRAGTWCKIAPAPQFNGQGPAQGSEGLAIIWAPWAPGAPGGRRRPRWNGGGKPATWHYPPARGEERQHETPKPVALCQELVRDFTSEGDRIWDPFAGAAPMGVAAIREARDYLGHEKNRRVADRGRRRLAFEIDNYKPAPGPRDRLAAITGRLGNRGRRGSKQ